METSGDRSYHRNLGNTVFTVLFSMIAMSVLYEKRWFSQLNLQVIQLQRDIVVGSSALLLNLGFTRMLVQEYPRFPAVALLQDKAATYQANLVPEPLKCFLNHFDPSSPMCSSLSRKDLLGSYSCNCNDSWVPGVQEEYPNTDTGHRYVSFRPAGYVISRGANFYMTIQAFFTYNTSHIESNSIPSPDLWLMVYDPSLEWKDAYYNGYGPITLFNANGVTTINIGLVYYESLNGTGYYSYDIELSTTPNINLVCDVSEDDIALCHTSLVIQIPRFDRSVNKQQMSMTWPDVATEAGSYFAFVQFLSWIFSGQVWATA
ncbi:hypothetical protein AOQ84DRAFT_336188 [Glonium stellatum]|uniref:Uncharacterized protein n=1 Tax=Glonium stellatum TaxID=574774 RepID=A0A8E2F648_9PEZI|nr:hypothetical protein AOQ84DRAFT_336188 [Glonium stellatum]